VKVDAAELQRAKAAVDQIVLDRLLSAIARRLAGAVDFWTLAAVGPWPGDAEGFLRHHSDILRSLIVATRELLGARAREEPCFALLTAMLEQHAQLERTLLALEQHRTLPLDEVRSTTQALADAYHHLDELLRQLGQALGVPITYLEKRTPDQEAHLRGILDRLFDICCAARHSHEPAAATAAAPH
jgi:hypothetical protein